MAGTNGLTWQRTADAIRAFVSQQGSIPPRRACLCTFDFNIERFEAVLLPELVRRGKQFRTLIAADAGALQAQLRQHGERRLGRYELAPVRCLRGGVFHPKLIFLSAGPRHLVGIGSANLTAGGLGGNLELMLFADDTNDFGRALVSGVARFLDRFLTHGSTQIPVTAREFIRILLAGTSRTSNAVLDSLDVPLIKQMANAHAGATRRRTTRRLSILSPWHSSGASPEGVSPTVLRKLKNAFNAEGTAVFTEGLNDKGPALGRGVSVHVRMEGVGTGSVRDDDGDDAERILNRRPMRVHAKAYLAETATGRGMLFFGSANCTQPALMLSASKGGNVELLVGLALDELQVEAIRADLDDLFRRTQNTVTPAPASAPGRAAGVILAGHLLKAAGGVHLELEAPSVRRGDIFISKDPKGPRLRVPVRAGVGLVKEPGRIRELFGGSVLGRESSTWGCVLWERLSATSVPFPVSIPLVAIGSDSPESFLKDLVFEELGSWPVEDDEGSANDDVSDAGAESEDIEALAAAQHEGRLDRIAVSIAILRRRILKSRAGRAYADERMDLLRRQVTRLDIPSHLRRVLFEYLGPPRHARRGAE